MEQKTDKILTAPEAAERLRISTRTLDRLCETGAGPRKIKISERRVGYLERETAAYVEARAAA
jgi:predicted DNA-binding transcriptional regulator AlpA